MSWDKVKFESLFSIPTRNGVYKSSEAHGNGAKIVNMGELFSYDFIGSQEMKRITMSDDEMNISGLKENDILFARRSLVEEGAGKASIIRGLNEPTTFESSIIRVRLNEDVCYPLFYFYWFRSYMGKSAISSLVTGTNVKGIRGSALKTIDIDYPSIKIQRRIADILSAYDNLIENNQKQIKLLEEAAQRLYKEWFVDLRFPGWESAKIVDGVPEGWRKCLLSDVSEINKHTIPKNYNFSTINYVDLSSVKRGHISEKTMYNLNDAPGRAKRIAYDGDIIWGMVRPNLCSYALVMNPNDKDVFSTGFAVISATEVPFTFLYCLVTTEAFVGYLVNCTNGAAYPAVKPMHFEEAKIVKPANDILNQFHSIIEPIYRKIEALDKEIIILEEARDRLLPKLMSGELEV